MSWLGWTKLRTGLRPGVPPQHDDVLPLEAGKLSAIRWRISLNGQPLGWARQQAERLQDGQGRVDSTVRIERLSVDQFVRQGFGGLGTLLARGLGSTAGGQVSLNLSVASEMHFDHFGQLQNFECLVAEDGWGECIRLQGAVRDDQLLVQAYLLLATDDDQERLKQPVYQGKLPLPPDRLLVDSLAPRPRFGQLRVGQSWLFATYNPLRPTSPLQTVEARVLDRSTVRHHDRSESAYHLVYQLADDDGLSLERQLGELWVTPSGDVLRQTMRFGQLTLAFEREDDPAAPVADPRSTSASAPASQPAVPEGDPD